MSVNTNYSKPVLPASFSPINSDDKLRIRTNAELAEIKDLLKDAHSNHPILQMIFQLLSQWHDSFSEALRHPDHQKVIEIYVNELEAIFHDPEEKFYPAIFHEDCPPPIRSIVEKMRDVNSILYSQNLSQQAPLPQVEIIEENDIEESDEENEEEIDFLDAALSAIDSAQELAQQEKNVKLNTSALNARVHHLSTSVASDANKVIKVADEAFKTFTTEMETKKAKHDAERKAIWQKAEQLEREAQICGEEAKEINEQLEKNKNKLNELEKANLVLEGEIKKLQKAIKKQKSSTFKQIACIAVSALVSWGLSTLLEFPVAFIYYDQ